MALYYIAIKKDNEVEYIYSTTKPTLNGDIIYHGKQYKVMGYINTKDFN